MTGDPAFAQRLAEELRITNRERLQRTESQLAVMGALEREGAARMLLELVEKPPFTNQGWEAERAVLLALAFDIYDLTSDPDESVSLPHPALVALFLEHDFLA